MTNILDLQRQADDAERRLKAVDAALLTLARHQRSDGRYAIIRTLNGTADDPDLLDLISQRTGFQSELNILQKLQRDHLANGAPLITSRAMAYDTSPQTPATPSPSTRSPSLLDSAPSANPTQDPSA